MNLKLKELLENYLKVRSSFTSNSDIDIYINNIIKNYDFKEILIFWSFVLDSEEICDDYFVSTNTTYLLNNQKLKKYKYVYLNAENNPSYYGNPFIEDEDDNISQVYNNIEDYIQSQINELVELYDSHRLDVFSSRFDKLTARKFKLKRIINN